MKSQRQWLLARVTKACRSAPAIWMALEQMSVERGSPVITPTRKELSELSGIPRVKTISRALTVLEDGGWISRAYVPISKGNVRCATLLRITLCRRGRKTPLTATSAVEGAKRPSSKGRKTPQSPTERGGLNGPALSLSVGSEPSRRVPYCEPQPIVAKQPVDKKTYNVGVKP